MKQLVSTVLRVPTSRSIHIDRPLLSSLYGRVAESQLTIISAPMGSGKTTAALDWFKRSQLEGRVGLWLAVRAGISSCESFLLALRDAGVCAGLPWGDLNPQRDIESWLFALSQISSSRLMLVVDDAHMLSAESLAVLTKILTAMDDSVTVIATSSGALQIPIGRIRAQGRLVEIGMRELCFDYEEAATLIPQIAGADIDGETVREIFTETSGWVSGLVIAARHFNHQLAIGGGLKSQEGSLRAEFNGYFKEEVLASQPWHLRKFLESTSILDKLTPAACAAVTADDPDEARQTLEKVYRAGLFLSLVEDERNCYTYEPLFRKAIADELIANAQAVSFELHRRASIYFSGEGDLINALKHAKHCGDMQFLAEQLDCFANELIYSGYLYYIDELSANLPWSILSGKPMLLLALAWRRCRELSFATAERLINSAAAIAEHRRDDVRLNRLVRHRQIVLAGARGDVEFVEANALDLIHELGDDDPYLYCTLISVLMSARRELFHFHDLLKLEVDVRRALEHSTSELSTIALKTVAAPILVLQGKTLQGKRFLEEVLLFTEARLGKGSAIAAVPALSMAEICYELGELDRASELINTYLPVARSWSFLDQLASGYLIRAKLAFLHGDAALALSGLEEAYLVAIEYGLDSLRVFVIAEKVRILAKIGRLADAESLLCGEDFGASCEPLPKISSTRKDECIAIAWLRVQLCRLNLVDAERVATRWFEFAKRRSAVRSIVVFQLILTQVAMLRANKSKALRAVRNAISLAEPPGWIQLFLDEGEVISSLLLEAHNANPGIQVTPVDNFISCLVAPVKKTSAIALENDVDEDSGVSSRLAPREMDILALVGGGLRNREIGERLGLTEGTVKWYMRQIYDKLGVRRRSQASHRARQFGLLN